MVRSHLEVLQLIKNYCFVQVAAFAILSLLQTFRPQSAFELGKKKPVEIRFASLIYNYCESKKVNFTLEQVTKAQRGSGVITLLFL
jgi:hypothetical protein